MTKALLASALGLVFSAFMLFVLVIFLPFELSAVGIALYAVPCLLAYSVGALIVLDDLS